MSSVPTLSLLEQPLSDFSAAVSDRKKIADAFINQAYKELVENPSDVYNMDIHSPSVPISFLYDLSNEPSSRGGSNIGLLRTTSSSDLPSFNFDETLLIHEGFDTCQVEFSMPSMPTERSLSAPCISGSKEELGEGSDDGGGTMTFKDLDQQLLAHVAAATPPSHPSTIFNNQYKYEFILDAPISVVQKKGDDTLTYLNKAQYYVINFLSNPNNRDRLDYNLKVKSIVHLVFRNQDRKKEYEHWTYWYSQQPNANIRVFDVDERACKNVEEISEIGCNAVSFSWNSNIGASIVLRINCLSTEFSSQKGVKGTPLYIQMDTFEDTDSLNPEPADRCYCQIKVFRDKGAERKNKDESRTAERKLQKLLKTGQIPSTEIEAHNVVSVFHKPCQQTVLTKTTVLSPKPVIFTAPVRNLTFNTAGGSDDSGVLPAAMYSPTHPITYPTTTSPNFNQSGLMEAGSLSSISSIGSNASACSTDQNTDLPWNSPTKQNDSLFAIIRERDTKRSISQALTAANEGAQHLTIGSDMSERPNKVARTQKTRPVTIYVRKADDKVYNALCLPRLSLDHLKDEVAVKYSIPKNMPVRLFKRTRKGLLINMDSRMIEQFQDEDDFIVEISFQNKEGIFEVTFVY